jgi:hypothetical protein
MTTMNAKYVSTPMKEIEAAVRQILLSHNIPDYIAERSKQTRVKAGTKLHFPLMDATAPDPKFGQGKARCERIFAEVQQMAGSKFPGFRADREMGRDYPQSNTYFKITIAPSPPPAPARPVRMATNIDQWLSGQGSISLQPGDPEPLPPTWHYIVIESDGRRRLPWVVIGPKSQITNGLLGREFESKTGTQIGVTRFTNYGSTYKPRTRWLLANGFFTDLTGREEARRRERDERSKLPPNRKPVVPSPQAFVSWLSGRLPHEYKKREEPEILPACWKRLHLDLHFVAEARSARLDWLVIEEHPKPVKQYHDLILADLQEMLGTREIVIKRMAVAGKDYIPAARALMKHGFYTDIPMAEIERERALATLDSYAERMG